MSQSVRLKLTIHDNITVKQAADVNISHQRNQTKEGEEKNRASPQKTRSDLVFKNPRRKERNNVYCMSESFKRVFRARATMDAPGRFDCEQPALPVRCLFRVVSAFVGSNSKISGVILFFSRQRFRAPTSRKENSTQLG
jgi:hypothetical protein